MMKEALTKSKEEEEMKFFKKSTVAILLLLTSTMMLVTDSREAFSEEIPLETSGEEIYGDFRKKLSFMEEKPEDYEEYYSVYGYQGEFAKIDYLEAAPTNTEEGWEEMSDFEKFAYDALYSNPKMYLMSENHAAETQEGFLNEIGLDFHKTNVPNGEVIGEAIRDVWVWHWMNWEQNGIFINIFEPKDEEIQQRVDAVRGQADELQREMEEAREDLLEGMKDEDVDEGVEPEATSTASSILKGIIIGVAVLVILAVAIFVVRLRNKKD